MTLQEVGRHGQHCMRTYSGLILDLTDPKPESICIEDIARGLSLTYRFNGHSRQPITVAEHSMWVAHSVDEPFKLTALLHDASEAYLGDMVSPIKSLMTDYAKLEFKLMDCIAKKFGFSWPLPAEVKEADAQALQLEWKYCVIGTRATWPNYAAEIRFLEAYLSIS